MLALPMTLAALSPLPWGVGVAAMILRTRFDRALVAWSILATLILGLSFGFRFGTATTLEFALASGVLAAHLLGLALIDARLYQVPDLLTIPFILTGLAHAWLTLDAGLAHLLCAMAIGVLITLAKLAHHLLSRTKLVLGSGDVLMIMGLCAWLGPFGALDGLMLSGLIAAVCMLVLRTRKLAFAPALGAATWIIWLYGPILTVFWNSSY